jgi:hypothetical protein
MAYLANRACFLAGDTVDKSLKKRIESPEAR